MLASRLLTASLLIVVMIGVFYLDGWVAQATAGTLPPGALLAVLLVLVVMPASIELTALLRHKGIETSAVVMAGCAIATGLTMWFAQGCALGAVAIATVLLASLAVTLGWHCRHMSPPGAMAAAGGTLLGAVYFGLGGGFFLAIRHEHAVWVVLAVLLITKSCDIGAYFTGHAIGRRKLIPWLSPGKTWEGLAGGVVLSVMVAVGFAWLSQVTELARVHELVDGEVAAVAREYHLGWAAVTGLLLAVIGHAGDLAVSLFKRDAGVKDSGATVPGFGGVLDLIDSPLLIAPVAYWMLKLAVVG